MKKIITAHKIYLSFNPAVECEAISVSDDRIERTGKLTDLKAHYNEEIEVIDYHDMVIMPGFVDSHMHLDELGKYLSILDLRGTTSISEFKRKLSTAKPVGGWILGHGWDQDLFREKRWPTRKDLDEVFRDQPVLLSRVDLHSAVVNSRALELLDLEKKFGSSEDMVKDSDGSPTGVLLETVFGYADDYVRNSFSDDAQIRMLQDAMAECARLGVTTVGFVSCSESQLDLLRRIREDGRLPMRIRAYIGQDSFDNFTGFSDDEYLRVTGLKLFSDGSLGSRTALLSYDYNDDAGNTGEVSHSREELLQYSKKAEEMGLHVAIHAIGDKALDNVLWAFSQCRNQNRVEHAALIRTDQFSKIKELGTTLVVQPHFVITDFWTIERVGAENAHTVYPFGTILKSGIPMAFSTDCPVEMLNPWETVYAAVLRGKPEKIPLGLKTPDECINVESALDYYTKKSANAVRDRSVGSIESGKMADFIVLDVDPLHVNAEELKDLKVRETWVGGSPVKRIK